MLRLRPSLFSITAHARSGALEHAWRLFREGGYEAVDDDPEVLTVRGRLLKDRALAASGLKRRSLCLAAAASYAQASELSGGAYPLINAATLSLLASDGETARARAAELLDLLDAGETEPDTPYWREATRAEALLVLGRIGEAQAALAGAMARAPRAWEDHASTLRQFALILAELGEPAAWLDPLRPPRTLHFAGHMGVAPDDEVLLKAVREALEAERIGFGFGSLAAGADILIAEALLECGAELHLALPADVDDFRTISVERFGEAWTARFDRLLRAAESVNTVLHSPGSDHPLAIRLAAETAMGDAVIKARMLTTEAVQLLVLDGLDGDPGAPSASAWSASHWAASGRRQCVLTASRAAAVTPRRPPTDDPEIVRVAALLGFDLCASDEPEDARLEQLVVRVFPRLEAALDAHAGAAFTTYWDDGALVLAFDTPAEAAAAALSIAAEIGEVAPVRAGGHYGLVRSVRDPLSKRPLVLGPGAAVAGQALSSAPTGAIHVTEPFAAALAAGPVAPGLRTEYVGDLPMTADADDVRLYSLQA